MLHHSLNTTLSATNTRTHGHSPAERVVQGNTLVIPFPFIVERKAAAGRVDESELLHSSPSPVEEGCGVRGAAAPSSQLLRRNNRGLFGLFIESRLELFGSG